MEFTGSKYLGKCIVNHSSSSTLYTNVQLHFTWKKKPFSKQQSFLNSFSAFYCDVHRTFNCGSVNISPAFYFFVLMSSEV